MTLLSGAWEVTPMRNVPAEEAVLGAVMLADTCLPLILQTGLRPEHFCHGPYADLFARMCHLHDQGTTIDPVTLPAGEKFSGSVPLLGNVERYAKQIIEASRWHDVYMASHHLREAAETGDENVVAQAERLLIRPETSEFTFSRERLQDRLIARLENPDVQRGWQVPLFSKLAVPGTLWLFGAWTSHGKTIWVDQMARCFNQQGANVWAWINEMTSDERIDRHVSAETGIDLERVSLGDLDATEMSKAARSAKTIPFGIVECPGWSAEEIARDIRVRKVDVAIVDILHRIPYETERDLGRIMQVLSNAAKLANCVIIATVHLNRGRQDQAAPPIPTMRDIKGASSFEQDADVVGMVYVECDEVTGKPLDQDGDCPGLISLLKIRQGKPSGRRVIRQGARARFVPDNTYA